MAAWRAAVCAAFATALALALLGRARGVAVSARRRISGSDRPVVDQPRMCSPPVERADLEGKLADLESKSGIQLVVATVPSLDGEAIEPYANALFRAWKLGEAKKNNGVLFLVAPNEHRVRIEVGYGLEGTLTDATSAIIIANAVAPRFKAGDFDGGVARGVEDIVTVLTTDSADWQKKPELRAEDDASSLDAITPLLFILVHSVHHLHARVARRRRARQRRSSCRPSSGAAAARSAAAASAAAAADFPAAADRRAAAAPRGVGDADRRAPAERRSKRPSAPRSSARARRSSACWRAPPANYEFAPLLASGLLGWSRRGRC